MRIQGIRITGERVVDASIVTPSLAIWIDANDPASYPGTGTTVTDLSGNGRTQTLTAAAAYTVLNGVKCWDFTTTNYMDANVIGPVLPTSGFTYIMWVRLLASTAGYRTFLRATADHPIIINTGTNDLGMYDNTVNAFFSAGYDVSALADVWAQWTVTGSSAGQTFYINGEQVGTTVQTAAGNSHRWTGNAPPGAQPPGYVANMFLYTSILTQEQIQQNYYALQSRFATPANVTTNLVLWYDPSDLVSYPGSGTTITNLANASLPGTMSNITYTSPYFAYNGSTSQVTIADNALLEPGSGDWTMEVWVYQTAAAGSQVILGKFDPGGLSADVSYAIRVINGSVRADFGNGTTAISTANYALPLNTWTQLVYVFNNVANNNVITYVNGQQQATTTHSFASILNTSANLYLGSYNGGEYAQWFNGRIGATRLYNAALTAAEVLQNYNADRGAYGL